MVALTLADPPVETTHWTADLMARASGTLFAALNVLDGTVIGRNMQRHPLNSIY